MQHVILGNSSRYRLNINQKKIIFITRKNQNNIILQVYLFNFTKFTWNSNQMVSTPHHLNSIYVFTINQFSVGLSQLGYAGVGVLNIFHFNRFINFENVHIFLWYIDNLISSRWSKMEENKSTKLCRIPQTQFFFRKRNFSINHLNRISICRRRKFKHIGHFDSNISIKSTNPEAF